MAAAAAEAVSHAQHLPGRLADGLLALMDRAGTGAGTGAEG
jgi:hypothetical protein